MNYNQDEADALLILALVVAATYLYVIVNQL